MEGTASWPRLEDIHDNARGFRVGPVDTVSGQAPGFLEPTCRLRSDPLRMWENPKGQGAPNLHRAEMQSRVSFFQSERETIAVLSHGPDVAGMIGIRLDLAS